LEFFGIQAHSLREECEIMAPDKRSLHVRLQEYCDCYMEADPKAELDRIATEGIASDVTGDPEEVALKFLGLAIFYGIRENARKFTLVKTQGQQIQINIEAAGKYKLPSPSAALADQIFRVMRSITHLESGKGSEALSLGIRNDRIELGVAFDSTGGQETLAITFPEL
jgi:hypothetical protein